VLCNRGDPLIRVKSTVKAGVWPASGNHNEAVVRAGGLKAQTGIKGGMWPASGNHNEAVVRAGGLKVQTSVKAGALASNHNEAVVRVPSLKVKTSIKAGGWPVTNNHNEAVVRAGGLKVQTRIKAGAWPVSNNHNEAAVRAGGLKAQTSVKAGSWPVSGNHNEAVVRVPSLKVKTSIKAGDPPTCDPSGAHGCHPAGEQVSTPAGWVNIESIKPGDMVHDHEGQTRKVRAVMVRRHQGEMITVRPMSRHNSFRLTPEHPVLAVKRQRVLVKGAPRRDDWLPEVNSDLLRETSPEWIKAGELEEGDFLFVINRQPLYQVGYDDDKHWGLVCQTETHFIVPIRAITREPWDDRVFNLDVEETHSYAVRGVAVLNCTAPLRDENQPRAAVVELVAAGAGS
jgi:hypothetical protein